MSGLYGVATIEVGNGAGYLEDAVVGTGRSSLYEKVLSFFPKKVRHVPPIDMEALLITRFSNATKLPTKLCKCLFVIINWPIFAKHLETVRDEYLIRNIP